MNLKRIWFAYLRRKRHLQKLFSLSKAYNFTPSYSQYGQDIFVRNYYLGKPPKERYIYVDIGANDGFDLSNTYGLEHDWEQNWHGILIEADQKVYDRCLLNRNKSKNFFYNVAVSKSDDEVDFMHVEGAQMLSGIVQEYDPRHLEWIHQEIKKVNGSYTIYKMGGLRFKTIMSKHPDIKEIDYLSIDVEGGEMKILQSIDFTEHSIKLIGIEDNYPDSSGIGDYLTKQNYREICRLGCDRFFEKMKEE